MEGANAAAHFRGEKRHVRAAARSDAVYRVTLGRADHLDCSYRAGKKAMFTTCCSYPTKRTSRRHRPASPSRLLRAYPECTQSNFLGTSQVQRTRISI